MGGVYRSILKSHYVLSYDETLLIINKPKHPPPPKREENKEQNERVEGLVSLPYKGSQQNIIGNQSNNHILAIGCMIKIKNKRIKFLDLNIVSHNSICFLYVQIFVNPFS
jgi:hypothetical protein